MRFLVLILMVAFAGCARYEAAHEAHHAKLVIPTAPKKATPAECQKKHDAFPEALGATEEEITAAWTKARELNTTWETDYDSCAKAKS